MDTPRRLGRMLFGAGVLCLAAVAAVVALLNLRGGGPASFPLRPAPEALVHRVEEAHRSAMEGFALPEESRPFREALGRLNAAEAEATAALATGGGVRAAEASAAAAAALEEAARQGREYLRKAGAETFRRTAILVAQETLAELGRDPTGRTWDRTRAGAFPEQVALPSGLLGPLGFRGPRARTTARVLVVYRILTLAADLIPDLSLTPDENLLFLHWKVEQATLATAEARRLALDELEELDPTYPAARARAILATMEKEKERTGPPGIP